LRADVSLGPDNRSRGYGTVLLATAEDAGRAVDMFNGYTWQTRVLEVRLDRLMPEYEHTRLGSGMGVLSTGAGAGISGSPSIASPYLGLGVGGSVGGANPGFGSGFTALAGDTDPSTHLASRAGFHPGATPILRESPFSQKFSPRPPSSSAAVQDPLDFLHSSTSAADPSEFHSDSNATRTLFVGNVGYSVLFLFLIFLSLSSYSSPFTYNGKI
jgi:hypothetical protein